MEGMDLEQALDYWQVHQPGDTHPLPDALRELWLVDSADQEQAWFDSEDAACRYRLFRVALSCNPLS